MNTPPPGNKTLFDVARYYMAAAAAAVVPERPLHRFPHFVKDWEDCMRYCCVVPGEGWSVVGTVHLQQRYIFVVAEYDGEPGIGYVITSRDPVVHRVDLETGEILADAEREAELVECAA